jgi:quercetin dioxygenase-like cupin family protein
MTTLNSTVRTQGTGERRWFCGGGTHTWLATSVETGGVFLLFEDELELGKVTPLHRHPDADETFYVLEGRIDVHLDGELHSLTTGGIAVVPRGIPHAFRVTSHQARVLCLQTPGSGEDFYRLASEPVVLGAEPIAVDLARVGAAAAETRSIEILGPPPF